jgi:hypothetical protein
MLPIIIVSVAQEDTTQEQQEVRKLYIFEMQRQQSSAAVLPFASL